MSLGVGQDERDIAHGGPATEALGALDTYLDRAIERGFFPGAAVAFGHAETPPVFRFRGRLTYDDGKESDDDPAPAPDTRYDLSCLTKVMALTSAVMRLVGEGRIDFDAPVADVLPAFGGQGKDRLTWAHLLTHTGGLRPSPYYGFVLRATKDEILEAILTQSPRHPPGEHFAYACDGFVVMGLAIEALTGLPLDAYLRHQVFDPLGMDDTDYRPTRTTPLAIIAPTEFDRALRGRIVHGEVDEWMAWRLGGVSGNAGLFSSIRDAATWARALLGAGPPGFERVLPPAVVAHFRKPWDPPRTATRALGFDTRSPEGYTVAGRHLGPRSYGHTGNTGVSVWLDPDLDFYVVLFTNAVHPRRGKRLYMWARPRVTDLAWRARVALDRGG